MSDTFSHGDSDYLSDAQLAQLLKGINPVRVNRDPKGMSYVEAYEIRAHLTRIFGPLRWDEVVTDQRQVFEAERVTDRLDKDGFPISKWTVCWYAHCTLTIRSTSGKVLATYGEGATGDAQNFPSRSDAHDMAVKTAASQALKRCAMNLGDQFGLSLYQKGSTRPLVQRTLIWDPAEAVEPAAGPDSHLTSPLAPEGSVETGGDTLRETTSPPASRAPSPPAGPVVAPAAGGGGPALVEQAPAVDIAEPGTVHVVHTPDGPVTFYNDLAPAATGPTAPDADGGSPAASEESVSSPAEEPAAEEFPTASSSAPQMAAEPTAADSTSPGHPDPTPGNGSEPTAEDSGEDSIDAWERIIATMTVIRMSPPEEGLQILNGLMETAAQHRLATRRYPDSDKSLSVVLTETMRDARAAIERRKAAVQP